MCVRSAVSRSICTVYGYVVSVTCRCVPVTRLRIGLVNVVSILSLTCLMQTAEIVRRLLTRPVTRVRCLKVLHLLETEDQLPELLTMVGELPADQLDAAGLAAVSETLTEDVVRRHFATRAR